MLRGLRVAIATTAKTRPFEEKILAPTEFEHQDSHLDSDITSYHGLDSVDSKMVLLLLYSE